MSGPDPVQGRVVPRASDDTAAVRRAYERDESRAGMTRWTVLDLCDALDAERAAQRVTHDPATWQHRVWTRLSESAQMGASCAMCERPTEGMQLELRCGDHLGVPEHLADPL